MNPDKETENNELDQLISRITNERDTDAFAQLFNMIAPRIKSFCMSGNPVLHEVADELVQEVMWKVWKKIEYFDSSKASFTTWVFSIARNTRIDWLRQQEKNTQLKLVSEEIWYETSTDDQPYIVLQQRRNRRKINSMLEELPEKQMQVISKIYLEGKSQNEVATELDMPLGTVKSRVRLALNKLRTLIAE